MCAGASVPRETRHLCRTLAQAEQYIANLQGHLQDIRQENTVLHHRIATMEEDPFENAHGNEDEFDPPPEDGDEAASGRFSDNEGITVGAMRALLKELQQQPHEQLLAHVPAVSVGSFHGRFNEDFRSWFNTYELCGITNGWNEKRKLQVLPSCLRGAALTVYKDLPVEVKNDYKLLTAALLERLEPAEYQRLHSIGFHNRRQNAGESVMQFGAALQEHLTQAVPELSPETKAIFLQDHFIEGQDPALKDLVLISDPSTYEEALSTARKFEMCKSYANHIPLVLQSSPPCLCNRHRQFIIHRELCKGRQPVEAQA